MNRRDRRAGNAPWSSFEESGRGIFYALQALTFHAEDGEFLAGPEAIFHCTEKPEIRACVSLKIKHGVHHVLQDAWPSNAPFFGDVANQDNADIEALRDAQKGLRHTAYLTDGARSRSELFRI